MQDRAIKGRTSEWISIKDPCTGNTLAVIKNPKVKIKPYKSMAGVVDMHEYISQ